MYACTFLATVYVAIDGSHTQFTVCLSVCLS
eukprot:COSAG03_NODE_30170_length_166_cov_803.656716_1_plen_30_part_01